MQIYSEADEKVVYFYIVIAPGIVRFVKTSFVLFNAKIKIFN